MNIISNMADYPWLFSNNPEKDFSRKRKLDFSQLLHLCISMEAGTVKDELLKYFSYDADTITNSGFFQQRSKLLTEAFSFLFHQFNQLYDYTLYKDRFQLLACDGSSFTFTRNPSDEESYFAPDGKTTNGYNQVHLVPLYDLLSNRYVDAVVQPIRKKNEFQALASMIERYPTSRAAIPIFIADRGFHSYNVFAHAIEKQAFFLIRAKDINTQRLLGEDYPKDQQTFDLSVSRILTRTNSKKKHKHPEREKDYRFICKSVKMDFLPENSLDEYELSVRVLRFPITDDTYENIITNLPPSFSMDEIKELYNLRWSVETSFRDLKHTLGAMNFHSKTRKYIEMELWARMLLYNFCSIITGNVVIEQKNRKYSYQVNFSAAFKICHHLLGLHKAEKIPNIKSLIEKNILPIRHDRKYARQHRFRVPVSFTYRFK